MAGPCSQPRSEFSNTAGNGPRYGSVDSSLPLRNERSRGHVIKVIVIMIVIVVACILIKAVWKIVVFKKANQIHVACPFHCTCTNHTLDCRSHDLTSTPANIPEDITVYLYSDNSVRHLRLNYQSKPRLKLVDLSRNIIATAEGRVFEELGWMTHLNLANNKLDENTFRNNINLFKSNGALQFVDFSRNDFKVLLNGIFDGRYMNSLDRLDLSRNSIHTIETGAISNQHTLKTLDLSFNQITILSINTRDLTLLPSVEVLSLNDNQIASVKMSAFANMDSLQQLHLENNCIVEIQKGSFKNINLHTLNLANNQLHHVHKSTLRELHNLEELTLDNNLLLSLSKAFLISPNLKSLSISHMSKLHTVQNMAFNHMPSLAKLTMHSNPALENIHPQAFHGPMFNSIKQVKLAKNSLKWLPSELLPWNNLTQLDMKGNPWVCNCSMLWAKDQPNIQVTCHSPPSLRRKRLSDLSDKDLGCGRSKSNTLVIVATPTYVTTVLMLTGGVWYS